MENRKRGGKRGRRQTRNLRISRRVIILSLMKRLKNRER
jgi:hypothetical protein